MPSQNKVWTPERDVLLTARRSSGASAAQIARELGVSISAVHSRAYRLQLPLALRVRGGDAADRFWAKVDRRGEDDCWPWLGYRNAGGYGEFRVHRGRRDLAHRFAYELLVGPIPPGALIRHTCDTPACVNPAHHEPGTDAQNVRDRVERGRSATGPRHGQRKLAVEQVVMIRRRIKAGDPMKAIARDFGISDTAVRKIRDGKTWRE